MKKTVLILSLLALLLGGWVAALWLLPSAVYKGDCQEIRYGVNEGLELVEQDNGAKGKRYVVEDADGNELFTNRKNRQAGKRMHQKQERPAIFRR